MIIYEPRTDVKRKTKDTPTPLCMKKVVDS